MKPKPKSSSLPQSEAVGVSILRPLKGVDANLKHNLESSFRQDYPNFEIIFSVASANDPAVHVVNDLKREYPKVDAKLIIGTDERVVNPKVNNLLKSYRSAKNDTVWILDSNIYVDPKCLARSIDLLSLPNVGLIHHVPIGIRPHGLGSLMERAFMNTAHAKLYTFINNLNVASCVIGKSSMFRRSNLAIVGGLEYFGKYLAEDNIIAQTVYKQGFRHIISSDMAFQPLGHVSMKEYLKRRFRWLRIRKYSEKLATVVEPMTESIVCGILGALSFKSLFEFSFWAIFCIHMALWFLGDLVLISIIEPTVWDDFGSFLLGWVLRELTAFPVYVYAFPGTTVEWRGTKFQLNFDATAYPLDSPASSPSHQKTL
ncbi:hypothetical protein HDV05_004100 [Chytridiales sp. JEL 0842]|nr:hypothetical protein HDV05_004100 [Chytridiales sp. JEL 0842]